jgi:hypothetical protein
MGAEQPHLGLWDLCADFCSHLPQQGFVDGA